MNKTMSGICKGISYFGADFPANVIRKRGRDAPGRFVHAVSSGEDEPVADEGTGADVSAGSAQSNRDNPGIAVLSDRIASEDVPSGRVVLHTAVAGRLHDALPHAH